MQRAQRQLELLGENFKGLEARRSALITRFFIDSESQRDDPAAFGDGANTVALTFAASKMPKEALQGLSENPPNGLAATAVEIASDPAKHKLAKDYLAAKYPVLQRFCEGLDRITSSYTKRYNHSPKIRSFEAGVYSMLYSIAAEDSEFSDWMNEVRDLDIKN